MDTINWIREIDLTDRRNIYIALTAPAVGLATLRLLKSLYNFSTPPNRGAHILASPRKSLQLLSAQDIDTLPYPPDALPGGRDVDTPYGNIRVYEWGPEDGRKVLFIHGISTPCIAFAPMAKLLVDQGCRVMLFDLFGRGYSDAPDPELYPQNIQLFTSQILLALTSSPLAWTGTDRFSIIGYSLGGGIAASFASYMPSLIQSLVLLAPGGLIRPKHISSSSKLLYNNWLPQSLVDYYVGKRLAGGARPGIGAKNGKGRTSETPTAPTPLATSETPRHPAEAKDSEASLFEDRPRISVSQAVAWQVASHAGFLASFISSIKYAPVLDEHERWRVLGRRLEARRLGADDESLPGLEEGKVLILLGRQDGVIVADEVEEDATAAMGAANVEIVKLEGAHDVPIVNAQGCVDAILQFWGQ